MQEQHYVPKVYLKNFCKIENGFLFGSNFIDKVDKWVPPREYHINSICCADDFYRLEKPQADSKNIPANIIEETAFGYERFFISKITKKLKEGNLTKEEISGFARFYISMKHRNPKFREGYTRERIMRIFVENQKKTREKFSKSGIPLEIIDNAINQSKDHIDSMGDISKVFHTNSLLNNISNPTEPILNAFQKLITSDILVYIINDKNNFFITTDNPGYSVDNKGKAFNVKFLDDAYHLIPLSSKVAVTFQRSENSNDNYTNVRWVDANKEKIDIINLYSAMFRNNYLYCEEKEFLKNLTERLPQLFQLYGSSQLT